MNLPKSFEKDMDDRIKREAERALPLVHPPKDRRGLVVDQGEALLLFASLAGRVDHGVTDWSTAVGIAVDRVDEGLLRRLHAGEHAEFHCACQRGTTGSMWDLLDDAVALLDALATAQPL